ncbi:hypothetical protein [Winogradskyella sp. PG-2]|uniref:hypothetical protein n=1 Tax=Winogradskyella sp. PG-2 TaxID=754409 RepID=UPI000458691E|nr:hypothetical protein [Winogradskyella sp. PG-2]BAO76425.1 hypothetical protein WPG_2195 [Winogradskyella sp. PG-2]
MKNRKDFITDKHQRLINDSDEVLHLVMRSFLERKAEELGTNYESLYVQITFDSIEILKDEGVYSESIETIQSITVR